MAGSVAGGAAWFEFGGDRMSGLFERRVVVEYEQLSPLTIDAFVVVAFVHDPLLTRRWMAPTVRSVDRATLVVVGHRAYERPVEALTHSIVSDRRAIIER